MGLLNWLRTKRLPSMESIILNELKECHIEYKQELAEQISQAHPEAGFAIYNRFKKPFSTKTDTQLAENIHCFLSLFNTVLKQNKQKNMLRLAYVAYITWDYITSKCLHNAEQDTEPYEQTKYLKLNWKTPEVDIEDQIKSRIRPGTTLKSIGIDFSDILNIEKTLKNYGQTLSLTPRTIANCENQDIAYLIRKLNTAIAKAR